MDERARSLHPLEQKSLEILAFWVHHRHRVVNTRSQAAQQLGINAGIDHRSRQNFLKQIKRYRP